MMDWNLLWAQLLAAGPAGVTVGLLVLVFVYIGTLTDIFKDSIWKRVAAIVAALLFSGVEPGNVEAAMVGAIGLAVATLLKLGISALAAGIKAEVDRRKAGKSTVKETG